MAGNVTASINPLSGNLVLNGDIYSNSVAVHGTEVPGQVIITPLEDQFGQPTTVNGSTSALTLDGVTGGLAVQLWAGNDRFSVRDFAFAGDGFVSGDLGADEITIGAMVPIGQSGSGDVSFTGNLWLDEQYDLLPTDNDILTLGRVVVGEYVEIDAHLGNNTVQFYNVTILGQHDNQMIDALRIRAMDGNDVYNLAYTTVHGDVDFSIDGLVGGHDLVSVITSVVHGRMYINVWHGSNTIALNANQFLGALDIWTEIGNDSFTLTNSYCVGKISMTSFYSLSNGNDYFNIQGNIIANRLYMNAGSGNDIVFIQGNQINNAGIFCGAGPDALFVRYNVFANHSDFLGGFDYDTLYFSGNWFQNAVPHQGYYGYSLYEFESQQA